MSAPTVIIICAKETQVCPVGTASLFYGSKPPKGWLLADGGCHKRDAYPALAAKCRAITPWWRWWLLRQFNLPTFSAQGIWPNSTI